MALIELKISQEVAAGTEVCIEEVIPTKRFEVVEFEGESGYDLNTAVRLVWKFEHATETEIDIWSIKGTGKMPFIDKRQDGDNVRKIALCLKNSLTTGSVFMSGIVRIKTI